MGVQSAAAVTELAEQASQVTEAQFDKKFCKALKSCDNFQIAAEEAKQVNAMEEYFSSLKTSVPKLKEEIEELEKPEKDGDSKKSDGYKVTSLKKQLETKSKDLDAYEKYLKDPTKVPHPMKAKGVGLTVEEKAAFQKEQAKKYEDEIVEQ